MWLILCLSYPNPEGVKGSEWLGSWMTGTKQRSYQDWRDHYLLAAAGCGIEDLCHLFYILIMSVFMYYVKIGN